VTLGFSALAASLVLAGAGSPRPAPVASLSASPARVALAGGATATIALRNFGRSSVSLAASSNGLVLDLRGRPALVARAARRSAAAWLRVQPRRLSLAPGSAALVIVRSTVPRGAEPGDHHAVVLFSSRALHTGRVGVRMRVGVRVVVRVPGTVVRRLAIRGLHVRRHGRARVLEVGLANLGNVTEALAPGRVVVSLLVAGRVAARARTQRRELLPRSYGIATGKYVGALRGRILARVETRGARQRMFWIRL
jgi:hypothetical protein